MTWIDWLILVAYAAATIGLGWYFSRKQRTTKEYFTGTGHMNPILIGVSLFATLLSTTSYLSYPGEIIGKGPAYLINFLAYPFIFLVVGFFILPVYMKQRVTSAYELLEDKLGLSIRLLGAIMFIFLRLVWMSLLMYLTAKAMSIMLGLDERYIPVIVVITGFVAVIYTSLGGLRAVVITDLMQTILLYGGALAVIIMVTVDFGGFGWLPSGWQDHWDTQPVFSLDPSVRVTFVGSIVSVFLFVVCTSAGDQTTVQRYMATEDVRASRRSLATQLCVAVVVLVTLGFVGLALMGYFQMHPEYLTGNLSLKEGADNLFPHYITFHLPPGVSGFVVAAMFAAAMSSIDSGVNSISAVVLTDMVDRFGKSAKSEAQHFNRARMLAFLVGAVVVVGSTMVGYVPGNITAMTKKSANLLTTPIFALFFFALFVPFARPVGVWVGAICGTTTAVLIAFSGPIFGADPETGLDPISFQWIAPCALTVNLVVGCVVSWLANKPQGTKS
jgi:SSS family solute:Na+ symporter